MSARSITRQYVVGTAYRILLSTSDHAEAIALHRSTTEVTTLTTVKANR